MYVSDWGIVGLVTDKSNKQHAAQQCYLAMVGIQVLILSDNMSDEDDWRKIENTPLF